MTVETEVRGNTLHVTANWDFEGGLGVGLYAFGAALCRAVNRGDLTEDLKQKLIDDTTRIAKDAINSATSEGDAKN